MTAQLTTFLALDWMGKAAPAHPCDANWGVPWALSNAYNNRRGPHFARMTGYASQALGDDTLAQRAWLEFPGPDTGQPLRPEFAPVQIEGPDIAAPREEAKGASTNNTAQWCLNAIGLLELVSDHLPERQAPG